MAVVNFMEKVFEMLRGDVADLKQQVSGIDVRVGRLEDRMGRLEDRTGRLDLRMERIEERLEAVELRLDHVETALLTVTNELRTGFGTVISLLTDHGTRGRAIRTQVDDHEERIAALESDPPDGTRTRKH